MSKSDVAAVAQISSFAIGLEGFGDNVSINDVNGFVSNADSIKQQAALDALSSLDFTKRMPQMLFTADFSQDGIVSDGSIVGWRKMFDAAGYIITRHDVFRDLDVTFTFTAAQLAEKQKFVSEYISKWVLSFYELDGSRVVAWLDDSTERDSFYTYVVTAYQSATVARGQIFSVSTSPVSLSATKLAAIRADMAELVFSSRPRVLTIAHPSINVTPVLLSTSPTPLSENDPKFVPDGVTADGISPYPYISRELYGDDRYDWLIAGTNVKAAFDRKENVEKIRSFSYIGSSLSFISDQITQGRFVVPGDISLVIKNVEAAIASDGVARTLTEILDGTGMLFFFGDKDVAPGSNDVDNRGTTMLATIISSIDQTTATIDPRRLVSNMSAIARRAPSTQTIIDIPLSVTTDHTSDARLADQTSQFVGDVSSDVSLIDLTTFAGLSRLIRTIRTYFDFNPARAT